MEAKLTQTPPIDMTARRQLALLARQLAAGAISNDGFERQCPVSRDPAVSAIAYHGLWPLYNDFYEHRLEGRWGLGAEDRQRVARMVLFLRSGCAYRYPEVRGWAWVPHLLLSLMTLGWFSGYWRRRLWAGADESVWPFFSRCEYEAALRKPVFFTGVASGDAEPDHTGHAARAVEPVV